jgi:hypothetical protein
MERKEALTSYKSIKESRRKEQYTKALAERRAQ